MTIQGPIISASSIERAKARTLAIPRVYNRPETNPALVSTSYYLEYRETTTTNYILASENFIPFDSESGWYEPINPYIDYVVATPNSVSSPIGTMTADRLRSDVNYGQPGGGMWIRQYATLSTVEDLTFSVYLKVPTGSLNIKILLLTGDFSAGLTIINETNANLTTAWQRFSVTGASPDLRRVIIQIGGYGTWGLNQEIDFWGAQLEISSTMGPYVSTGATIPTNGPFVSQTVTGYEQVSAAPTREGQIVSYYNNGAFQLYVAVDIDGVITWKPCIGIAEYLNPTTGLPPDPNILLYSPLLD